MACGTFGESIGGPASYVIVAGGIGYVDPLSPMPVDRVEIFNVDTGNWQGGTEIEADGQKSSTRFLYMQERGSRIEVMLAPRCRTLTRS